MDRLHRLASAASERQQRQHGKPIEKRRARAARTIHQRWLHNRGGHAGHAQVVVGGALAQMKAAGRARVGPKRRKLDHAPDALPPGGVKQRLRSAHVHCGEVARAPFAKEAHGVDDGVHVFQQRHPGVFRQRPAEIHGYESCVGRVMP